MRLLSHRPQPRRGGLLLALALLCAGCGAAPLDPHALEGRWLDQKYDTFLDFTRSGLCAEVSKSPDSVIAYNWEIKSGQLTLKPLGQQRHFGSKPLIRDAGATQVWSLTMQGDTMKLQSDNGKSRRLKKMENRKGQSQLEGLWQCQRPTGRIDYCEYTPWGDRIGISWYNVPRLDAEGKLGPATPCRLPEWHAYKAEGGLVELEGYSLKRKIRLTYNREGDKLTTNNPSSMPKTGGKAEWAVTVWTPASKVE